MNAYYVERYGAHIHYHDLPGRDPTCVFFHGLGSASSACFPRAADPAGLHRSAVSLIAERRPTCREHLPRLDLPRTFLFGEENLPDRNVDRLTADGVDVRVISRSGHDMMGDNPDGFAEAVTDAIEGRG